MKEQRTKARRGGHAKSNSAQAKRQMAAASLSPTELEGFLELAPKGVLADHLSPDVGNAVANLRRATVAVREVTELKERLTELVTAVGVSRLRA